MPLNLLAAAVNHALDSRRCIIGAGESARTDAVSRTVSTAHIVDAVAKSALRIVAAGDPWLEASPG